MRVKPRPGLKVRHPLTKQHVPEDGLEIAELDTYWSRRILDGDLVVVDDDKPAAPAARKAQ